MNRAIIERVLFFARDPKRPRADDVTLSQLLVRVLEDIGSGRIIQDESLAVLYGIAAELFGRVRDHLPAPTRCDAAGRPVWSDEQVAELLGVPVATVHAQIAAFEAEGAPVRAVGETHILN